MPKLGVRLEENYSYTSLELSMINREYCQQTFIRNIRTISRNNVEVGNILIEPTRSLRKKFAG
jgi:hypothetical protein